MHEGSLSPIRQAGRSQMSVLQFKGKTAIERYHHTVPHHTSEFDSSY